MMRAMARCALLFAVFFVACGTVRTPFSSGPDQHIGEIACHGVLLPAKGSPRAFFLCAGQREACETSRRDQIAKGYSAGEQEAMFWGTAQRVYRI